MENPCLLHLWAFFLRIHNTYSCKFQMVCTSQIPNIWWQSSVQACCTLSDLPPFCIAAKQTFCMIKTFQTMHILHSLKIMFYFYKKFLLFIEWHYIYIYIYIYNIYIYMSVCCHFVVLLTHRAGSDVSSKIGILQTHRRALPKEHTHSNTYSRTNTLTFFFAHTYIRILIFFAYFYVFINASLLPTLLQVRAD